MIWLLTAFMLATTACASDSSGELGYSAEERMHDRRYGSDAPDAARGASVEPKVRQGTGVYDTTEPQH